MDHYVILKTRCGCTRRIAVPDYPGRTFIVPLMCPIQLFNDASVTELQVETRVFEYYDRETTNKAMYHHYREKA